MHKIIIENECGCVRRSDLVNNQEITSKDDALSTAISMKNQMNDKFCGKHDFAVVEDQNNFLITFAQQKTSACCGGGHCS